MAWGGWRGAGTGVGGASPAWKPCGAAPAGGALSGFGGVGGRGQHIHSLGGGNLHGHPLPGKENTPALPNGLSPEDLSGHWEAGKDGVPQRVRRQPTLKVEVAGAGAALPPFYGGEGGSPSGPLSPMPPSPDTPDDPDFAAQASSFGGLMTSRPVKLARRPNSALSPRRPAGSGVSAGAGAAGRVAGRGSVYVNRLRTRSAGAAGEGLEGLERAGAAFSRGRAGGEGWEGGGGGGGGGAPRRSALCPRRARRSGVHRLSPSRNE